MTTATQARPFTEGVVDAIEAAEPLDKIATPVSQAVRAVLSPGQIKDAISGTWLSHPLHPALVQAPVGAFLGAGVLDATGDRGRGAPTLIGFGVLASVPAALAGLADYADGHE